MPSVEHQVLVELFRARPSLAPMLLGQALQVSLPTHSVAAPTSATLDQLTPPEFQADLVIELRDEVAALLGAIIVEVQLGRDPDKVFARPVYVATLRSRLRVPVWLFVVCIDESIARWAAEPIELGGQSRVVPMVLGPAEMPFFIDEATARAVPELTIAATFAHADDPRAEGLIRAIPAALDLLDATHARAYLLALRKCLGPALRMLLEKLTMSTDFLVDLPAPPWLEKLEAAASARGEARGEALAVLKVLEARGVAVGDDVRARVLQCADLPTLDRWLKRALTARTAATVVRPSRSSR